MTINDHATTHHSSRRTLTSSAAAVVRRAARPVLLATAGFGILLGGAATANAMPAIPPGGDSFQRQCADLVNQINSAVQDYYNGPRTAATLQAAKDKIGPAAQTYNQIGCAAVWGELRPALPVDVRRAAPPVAVQGATY